MKHALYLLMGLFVFLWSLVGVLTHNGFPLDIVEALVWGNEWLIGTNKHPLLSAMADGDFLADWRCLWRLYFSVVIFGFGFGGGFFIGTHYFATARSFFERRSVFELILLFLALA